MSLTTDKNNPELDKVDESKQENKLIFLKGVI